MRGADLRSETAVEALSDLKLRIVDNGAYLPGDLYAKAVPIPDGPAGVTRVRFTSVPAELERLLSTVGSGLDFLL